MSKSTQSTCPVCQKKAAPRAENPAFPFCSRRCRLIDLSHWLSEDYRVPVTVTERRLVTDVDPDE